MAMAGFDIIKKKREQGGARALASPLPTHDDRGRVGALGCVYWRRFSLKSAAFFVFVFSLDWVISPREVPTGRNRWTMFKTRAAKRGGRVLWERGIPPKSAQNWMSKGPPETNMPIYPSDLFLSFIMTLLDFCNAMLSDQILCL